MLFFTLFILGVEATTNDVVLLLGSDSYGALKPEQCDKIGACENFAISNARDHGCDYDNYGCWAVLWTGEAWYWCQEEELFYEDAQKNVKEIYCADEHCWIWREDGTGELRTDLGIDETSTISVTLQDVTGMVCPFVYCCIFTVGGELVPHCTGEKNHAYVVDYIKSDDNSPIAADSIDCSMENYKHPKICWTVNADGTYGHMLDETNWAGDVVSEKTTVTDAPDELLVFEAIICSICCVGVKEDKTASVWGCKSQEQVDWNTEHYFGPVYWDVADYASHVEFTDNCDANKDNIAQYVGTFWRTKTVEKCFVRCLEEKECVTFQFNTNTFECVLSRNLYCDTEANWKYYDIKDKISLRYPREDGDACPSGYTSTTKDVADGSQNVNNENVDTIEKCGTMCNDQSDCTMFEFHSSTSRCKLSTGDLDTTDQASGWQSCLSPKMAYSDVQYANCFVDGCVVITSTDSHFFVTPSVYELSWKAAPDLAGATDVFLHNKGMCSYAIWPDGKAKVWGDSCDETGAYENIRQAQCHESAVILVKTDGQLQPLGDYCEIKETWTDRTPKWPIDVTQPNPGIAYDFSLGGYAMSIRAYTPITLSPTASPTTSQPTKAPTTVAPTMAPTTTSPTDEPTASPTAAPTKGGMTTIEQSADMRFTRELTEEQEVTACDELSEATKRKTGRRPTRCTLRRNATDEDQYTYVATITFIVPEGDAQTLGVALQDENIEDELVKSSTMTELNGGTPLDPKDFSVKPPTQEGAVFTAKTTTTTTGVRRRVRRDSDFSRASTLLLGASALACFL